MKKNLLYLAILMLTLTAYGQNNNLWTKTNRSNTASAELMDRRSFPDQFELYDLDVNALKAILAKAPERFAGSKSRGITVQFPDADGELKTYRVFESSVLHPELARHHSDIRTYTGQGIDDPSATIKISTTLFGVHAMTLSAGKGTQYIDPYTKDKSTYIVYSKSALSTSPGFECEFEGEPAETHETAGRGTNETQSNTGIFRVYRLALSSTVEYSTFHVNQAGQGSASEAVKKATVLAAMVVTMNRVNGVYERDFALTMQLISNNTSLINISSDDFSNNSGGALLNQNQNFVDSTVGNGAYDIGHVFSTGGGGIAALGSVCNPSQKARGVTGSGAPVGDPFDIDYVAHEIGHQFGATHTFSSTSGSCNGNITNSTAVEPGSGSTIMAYAGICSPHNVQGNSDAHFHAVSMAQIDAHISGSGNCSTNSQMANNAPEIAPLADYTIPKGTSFVLRGNATDLDGNLLTYNWEQTNTGSVSQPPSSTNTTGASFRSRPPSISPDRYMPVLGSTSNPWEVIPTVARTLNFALTVRDNDIFNGGQTDRDDMVVNVVNVGPFAVTSPNTGVSWQAGSNQIVTWSVAGTTSNGINSQFVDIFMSSNGGNSYPVMLASRVPNDGSELITIPNSPGSSNRIMVMSNDNIFYDVSNANFTITAPSTEFAIAFNGTPGGQNKGGCLGTQNSGTSFTFNYTPLAGFNGSTTFTAEGAPAGSTVTFSPNPATSAGPITMTISDTNNSAPGSYPIEVTGTSGAITKSLNLYFQLINAVFTPIDLLSPGNNEEGLGNDVVLNWQPDIFNATAYDVEVATDINFANIISSGTTAGSSFSLSGLANLTDYYWRVLPKNNFCDGDYSATFKFKTAHCNDYASANVPLVISDSGTPTVNSTLTISNLQSQEISDLTVNIDISHSWIRDLTATLIGPNGTQVVLFSTVCANEPGHMNAVASFNDTGIAISCNANNPAISGKLMPNQSLSSFFGQSSEGVWTLSVSDSSNQDGGTINSWSLTVCGLDAPMTVEEKGTMSFAVFPNPSRGNFTVKSDKFASDIATIQVHDIRGRLIYQADHTAAGMLDTNVSLNNAGAGVYLVSVSDGENREVKRIIIE